MSSTDVTNDSLIVLGAGSNGINEMQDLLDDAAVQWALIRFELGSGAFVRKKLMFLHVNGEETPAVRRGQANAYTAEAQRLLRADNQEGFHASLAVTRKEDVTQAQLLERVGHLFVKDDIDYEVQLERTDSLRMYEKGKRSNSFKGDSIGIADNLPVIPKHQSLKLFTSGRDALKAVAEPLGRWNWALVRPDPDTLELVDGGSGSVDEMRESLKLNQQEGLSGMVRLGFGMGRLRRTKHVFVHAVGEKVPVVSRGRAAAARPSMEATLGKLVHFSVSMELARYEDLTLEDIIDRVRRAAIIDDEVLDAEKSAKSSISVEAFRDALKEEQISQTPSPSVEGVSPAPLVWREKPVADVVKLVHAADGPLNWALFGPNLARLRSKDRMVKRPSAPPVCSSVTALPAGGFAAARLSLPAGGFAAAKGAQAA